jgi:hypothetical protein
MKALLFSTGVALCVALTAMAFKRSRSRTSELLRGY